MHLWCPRDEASGRLLLAALVILLLALGTPVACDTADDAAAATAKAFASLSRQQTDQVSNKPFHRDYPGNWPQLITPNETAPPFLRRSIKFEDVSPFVVAFIHHALSLLVVERGSLFAMSTEDYARARSMRQLAVDFMLRFESPEGEMDQGTFGFWLYDDYPKLPGPITSWLLIRSLDHFRVGVPVIGGPRAPTNIPIMPDIYRIPTDADDTANILVCLLDDMNIDGGPGFEGNLTKPFTDYRDTGEVPLRIDLPWLPDDSGVYLTWFGETLEGSDVDLAVNANVLLALGRYGLLDTPGVDDAVNAINLATSLGLHRRGDIRLISEYYPNNLVFQYCVSRAYFEGNVTALQPSVNIFLDDLDSTAVREENGMVYWDTNSGGSVLNTALAVLTLLNGGGGRDTPIVEGAITWLVGQQKSDGSFGLGTFFIGGPMEWVSESLVTAMALEALARWLIYEYT